MTAGASLSRQPACGPDPMPACGPGLIPDSGPGSIPGSGPAGTDSRETTALELVWRAVYSPDGRTAQCRKCGTRRSFHRVSARRAFACDRCGSHLYPASGTPFAGSPLPLSAWLDTAAAVVESPGRVSPGQLADALELQYRTAWRMCRKVRASLEADGEPAQLLRVLAGAWVRQAAPAPGRFSGLARPENRIREAACRVMAKRGATAARIADIAAAAGVSAGSVHYYFRSKDEALLDALRWAGEQLHDSLRQLHDADVPPLEHLRRLLELSVPSTPGLHDEYLLWLEVWVRVRDHPAFLQESIAMSHRWYEAVRQVFARGVQAGLFTPVTGLDEVCERYVAMAESLGYRAALGYSNITAERAWRMLARFTAEQLGLAPSQLGCPEGERC
jgi:AcrR family transcriptional regulator/transposase-like protein